MDTEWLTRVGEYNWRIEPRGNMRVPGEVIADEQLIACMDDRVFEQMANVARLPGIVGACYAMPDAHRGYGFPVGGVAAFTPQTGVVAAGGVGFDIACGVRMLLTRLRFGEVERVRDRLADHLFASVPSGLGGGGSIHLGPMQVLSMLRGGARWAVEQGWGKPVDLERIEERGRMHGALPECVSARARRRNERALGTLGAGNHYIEVQRVAEVIGFDAAAAFGLTEDEIVVSIHSGSRGLGHQIGTEFMRDMATAARAYGIDLPDRELACAPIDSAIGEAYLGAMRAATNCALANRQVVTHQVRRAFGEVFPEAALTLLYDVSHNTCKLEEHLIDGELRRLYVLRSGATRAFGPGHAELPEALRAIGQPVFVSGSAGTASYVLVGTNDGLRPAFSSACHGAGRAISRNRARERWRGRRVAAQLARQGIAVRCHSYRSLAESAPGAYRDVDRIVSVADRAGIARPVVRLEPVICIKG